MVIHRLQIIERAYALSFYVQNPICDSLLNQSLDNTKKSLNSKSDANNTHNNRHYVAHLKAALNALCSNTFIYMMYTT